MLDERQRPPKVSAAEWLLVAALAIFLAAEWSLAISVGGLG